MIIYLPLIFYGNFQGMAIYPFIFVRYKYMKENERLINHEKIHLRQQLELFWIFFFIVYFAEFVINLIKYKNAQKAYYEISFEKEAYANENTMDYLKHRSFWSFLKYYK